VCHQGDGATFFAHTEAEKCPQVLGDPPTPPLPPHRKRGFWLPKFKYVVPKFQEVVPNFKKINFCTSKKCPSPPDLFVCLFISIKPGNTQLRLLLWPRSKTLGSISTGTAWLFLRSYQKYNTAQNHSTCQLRSTLYS